MNHNYLSGPSENIFIHTHRHTDIYLRTKQYKLQIFPVNKNNYLLVVNDIEYISSKFTSKMHFLQFVYLLIICNAVIIYFLLNVYGNFDLCIKLIQGM